MKALLVLSCVVLAAAFAASDGTVSQEFLHRQKQLLRLLWRVREPNPYPELVAHCNSFNVEDDNRLPVGEVVKDFIIQYKTGFLDRGEIFSVFHAPHRLQMMKLYELFLIVPDVDTFFVVACWARNKFNEEMFVYSLSMAVRHRKDLQDFHMPPLYEIFPERFVSPAVVNQAYLAKINHHNEDVYIPMPNYTEFWNRNVDKEVMALNYFAEDIGIGMFNEFMHTIMPFWMDSEKHNHTLDRKGEVYYWMYRQLLTRYETERLAHDMDEVKEIDFNDPKILPGSSPHTTYHTGNSFPVRPEGMRLVDVDDVELDYVRDFEHRIRDAIDRGYFYDREGHRISLDNYKGIDYIGRMIIGLTDFPTTYFGKLLPQLTYMISHVVDPHHTLGVRPGVLEHSETAPSDHAFYTIQKTMQELFGKHKDRFPPYKREQLMFPGVKVDSMELDNKLVTYVDDFVFDLYSLFHGTYESDKDTHIKVRMPRINHKPFNYKFEVTSRTTTTSSAVVRVFLAPKYDVHGYEMSVQEMSHYMIEMDKFRTELKPGKNIFTRSSKDASLTVPDETPTKELMRKIDQLIGSNCNDCEFPLKKYKCFFPEHMQLPKGSKEGMKFKLFVIVNPYEGDQSITDLDYCSSYDHVYPESRAMGFPFDRRISKHNFNVPNMYWKDVIIFHKTKEEINQSTSV